MIILKHRKEFSREKLLFFQAIILLIVRFIFYLSAYLRIHSSVAILKSFDSGTPEFGVERENSGTSVRTQ